MTIIDEIKLSFRKGSYLIRLIYINLAVFIIVGVVSVPFFLTETAFPVRQWFSLPSSIGSFITHPWTIITYMFFHQGIFHILFNLLWLYWFGRIFLEYFDQRKLVSLYLLGGICGGFLYMTAYNLFPIFKPVVEGAMLLGASASVIAIVIAVSYYAPNRSLHLVLIGPVKLKYIAVISVILYILQIASTNSGGNIAHLGGAAWGLLWAWQVKQGKDISSGFEIFMDHVFTWFKPRKRNLKVTYRKKSPQKMKDWEYNASKSMQQKEINRILDKIGKSGYESLSREEKDILFKMGRKNQK